MLNKFYELKEFLINKKFVIIISAVLIVSGVFVYLVVNKKYFSNKSDLSNSKEEIIKVEESINAKEEKVEKCMIDVKGYVENIGLYEVDCNSRVNDVINIAGGLKSDADTSVINLGKKIKDGMVIVIYSKDEVADFIKVKKEETIKEEKCKASTVIVNDACITKEDRVDNSFVSQSSVDTNDSDINNTNNSADQGLDNKSKMISINTATKEELMTLNGVGESKALAIIAYREEHGLFTSIEDLKNVTGIGEKIFESIKNYITL